MAQRAASICMRITPRGHLYIPIKSIQLINVSLGEQQRHKHEWKKRQHRTMHSILRYFHFPFRNGTHANVNKRLRLLFAGWLCAPDMEAVTPALGAERLQLLCRSGFAPAQLCMRIYVVYACMTKQSANVFGLGMTDFGVERLNTNQDVIEIGL